jgi:hypothetical protein
VSWINSPVDDVYYCVAVHELLQCVVFPSPRPFPPVDDLVESRVQHGPQRHAQQVDRRDDPDPREDDAGSAVAAVKKSRLLHVPDHR